MLDIGADKILVVLIVALVVLGPSRIGEAARALGRARAQLGKLTSDLPPDAVKMIRNPRGALLDAVSDERQMMADTAAAVRQTVNFTTEPSVSPMAPVNPMTGQPMASVTPTADQEPGKDTP